MTYYYVFDKYINNVGEHHLCHEINAYIVLDLDTVLLLFTMVIAFFRLAVPDIVITTYNIINRDANKEQVIKIVLETLCLINN